MISKLIKDTLNGLKYVRLSIALNVKTENKMLTLVWIGLKNIYMTRFWLNYSDYTLFIHECKYRTPDIKPKAKQKSTELYSAKLADFDVC